MGFFDKIQETITSAAEQTKAKADEVQLKRERSKKLEVLGEQVYALYQNGQLALDELAPTCQEITALDQRIDAAQAAAQTATQPKQPEAQPDAGFQAAPGAPPQQPAPPPGDAATQAEAGVQPPPPPPPPPPSQTDSG